MIALTRDYNTGELIRKKFTYIGLRGNLKLHTLQGEAADENAQYYIPVGEVMVNAYFGRRDVNRNAPVPTDFDDWQNMVHDHLATLRRLPIEAVHFGYTVLEICQSRVAAAEADAARAAKREEDRQKAEAAEAAAQAEWLEETKQRIRDDEPITGEALVIVARDLGMEPHGRTVGMLRSRVREIHSQGGKVTGRGFLPDSAFLLLAECRNKLAG